MNRPLDRRPFSVQIDEKLREIEKSLATLAPEQHHRLLFFQGRYAGLAEALTLFQRANLDPEDGA
jgi:hypothetical protein